MSVLRRGGRCSRCSGFVEAGQQVEWMDGEDGKPHFFHPPPCPQRAPPTAPVSNGYAPTPVSTTLPLAGTPSAAGGASYARYEPLSVSVERSVEDEHGTRLIRIQGREGTSPEGAAAFAETLTRRVDDLLSEWHRRDRTDPPIITTPRTGVEIERERLAAVRAAAGKKA